MVEFIAENKMFENSLLVVAHPDDEILWFSSIIERVDTVLICFLDYKPEPDWCIGRKKTLSEYPIKNTYCLDLEESGAFGNAIWDNPRTTEYGLELFERTVYAEYIKNYFKLKERLKSYLLNYSNVFTHNLWGEYGHEDHVQVSRVLRELNQEIRYNLWFTNYYSNKSIKLASQYHTSSDLDYITFKTNKVLAERIRDLYGKNRCWTWYPDWEWHDEESFCNSINITRQSGKHNNFSKLNLIKIDDNFGA